MLYVLLSALAFLFIGLPYSTLLFFKAGNRKSILEIFILTAIIGPLIINYIIFTLGYAGLLSCEGMFFAIFAVFIAPFLLRRTWLSMKNLCLLAYERTRGIRSIFGRLTLLESFSLSLIVSILIITCYSAFMLPPTLRDPYAVWLFYGKKIMETKSIPLFYGNGYDISWSGNYPPLMSFLASYYFIALGQAIPQAFTHVSWLYGCLMLLATFILAKELALGKFALVSAFLLTTSSLFTLELINYGYVTVEWSFYVVTTCFYLVKLWREKTLGTSLKFGLSLGACLLSTYLSFIFVASLLTLLAADFLFGKAIRKRTTFEFKPLATGLIIAFVILLPWLARNYILLGNPVYPWFYDVFGGRGIDPSIMRIVPETLRNYNLQQLVVDNTFYANANEDIGYTLLVFGLIGTIYLVLRNKELTACLGWLTLTFFIFLVVSMTLIHGYERYLLMVAPLLAVSAGHLFQKIFGSKKLKLLAMALVILFSLPNYAYLMYLAPSGAGPGETQGLSYVDNYIDNYLPSSAAILTNEIQLYFINREVIDIYNMPKALQAITFIEVIDSLKSQNVTHVLINTNIDMEFLKDTFLISSLTEHNDTFEVLLDIPPYIFYEVNYEGSI